MEVKVSNENLIEKIINDIDEIHLTEDLVKIVKIAIEGKKKYEDLKHKVITRAKLIAYLLDIVPFTRLELILNKENYFPFAVLENKKTTVSEPIKLSIVVNPNKKYKITYYKDTSEVEIKLEIKKHGFVETISELGIDTLNELDKLLEKLINEISKLFHKKN